MIEVNLLPDVKQEFIRAQNLRNVVISISIISAVVAGGIILVLGLFLGAQAVRDSLADKAIDEQYKKLNGVSDISKIVTIQNRLSTISTINSNRLITSRLLDTLAAVNPPTPNDIKMSNVKLDPTAKTVTIEGTAKDYVSVDVFKKTIIKTTLEYILNDQTSKVALSDNVTVVDTSFGEDTDGAKVVRFTLSLVYNDNLFSNQVTSAQIVSPTGRTDVTDSKAGVPDSLFSTVSSAKGGTK